MNIFGNLDDCYRAIDNGEAGLKPAQLASLEELRPRMDAVRALVTMRTDVPLDVAQVFNARVPKSADTCMEAEPMEEVIEIDENGELHENTLPRSTASNPETTELAGEQPPKTTAHGPTVASDPAPAEWERGLEPRSMNDAVRLAQRMHDSHMFSAYGTPQAVLSTVLLGRELGMPAMAALRTVHIIEGKHSLSADLMVALVLKSGLAEYFQMVESNDSICSYTTRRKGTPMPTSLSYTIEQAEQAGLLQPTRSGKPSNWDKMPKQMLRARAKSELARLEYPDLLAGLYTPEELRDAKAEVA